MTRRTGVVALLALAVVLSACRKKEPEAPAPPPATTTPTATRDTAAENEAARRAAAERERAERERLAAEARATLTEMVFFDYDRADIRSDMQDVLNRKATLLRANADVALRIDGHADERGTVEYNLALSLRRANAVREYLTSFGIDVGRLDVAGFGEEQPLDPASNESAWARNRRAEFHVTRGGDNLVPAR